MCVCVGGGGGGGGGAKLYRHVFVMRRLSHQERKELSHQDILIVF